MRRIIMVGTTFLLAVATGHLMQGGAVLPFSEPAAAPPKVAQVPAAMPATPKPATIAAMTPQPAKPAVQQTAAAAPEAKPMQMAGAVALPVALVPAALLPTTEQPGVERVASRSDSQPTDLPKPAEQVAALPECNAVLTLSPAAAAMIDLSLNAPCDANARVVIRHSGLTLTAVTSETGLMQATIPAMSVDAQVVVALPNGVKAEATIRIPSLVEYDRLAVQWQGTDRFELHAFEFGADYGDEGHVSANNPRVPTVALQAMGGFMVALGDAQVQLPMLAEVYTFPAVRSKRAGDVAVSIEAQVAAQTCGREMLAETLEARRGAAVKVVELSLEMPGCDGIGDFVILNNLLPGVKVAAN